MKLHHLVLPIAACVLAGCVGVSTHVGTDRESSGHLCGKPLGYAPPRTQDDVRNRCGKPVRVETYGNDVRWTYRDGLAWRGLLVWVVVPLPLVLPVGFDYTTVGFDGDRVREIETETARGTFFGCGPFFGHLVWDCGRTEIE